MTIFEIKSTYINKNGLVHTEIVTANTLKMFLEESEKQILRYHEIIFPDSISIVDYNHCELEDEINKILKKEKNGSYKITYKVLRK
jgi:hypothetical protein